MVGSDIHLKGDEVTASRYRPSSNEREAVEDDIVAFLACGTTIAQITPDHQRVKPSLVVELEDK